MTIPRCSVCGKPWTAHLSVEGTCRLHLAAVDALVKILAVCDAWGDGGRMHEAIVRIGERGLDRARILQDGEWRLP
ncbi:hypothetical protein [Solidesulfovibrio sp. C21]|uniref:hypothetical protein n=1 Tax=Solidesulfovibrio sp. C21 TaxID=3398613 RepID=UPI0039FCC601